MIKLALIRVRHDHAAVIDEHGKTVGADANGKLQAIEGRYVLDSGGIPGTPTTLLM